MDEQNIIGLIGQGGLAAALIAIIWMVGLRMVAALDRVAAKLDAHTKEDLAAQAEVRGAVADLREDVAVIGARLDTALDLTPIRGVPTTYAQHRRGRSEPGEK